MEIKLPNLGDGVESGDIVEVLVKAGDDVAKDQQVWAVCWYDVTSREYVAAKIGITGV